MSGLKLRGLRKSYGGLEVIKGVDLDVDPREFVVFVGRSGCGKSTLLRMIAGLEEITAGELRIGDKVMTLADKIVVLRDGVIEQVGVPLALTIEIVEHLGARPLPMRGREGRCGNNGHR